MWWDGGWHMAMWLFGPLGLLFVALVALLSRGGSGAGPSDRETPEQILKRRYAGGEIDHDDFTRRMEDLRR